jgi:trigger factor
MRSEFISQEKNRIEIKVEFETSEFNAELNKVLKNISERAKIPGFRKGHVPRKAIEMRFGKNAIYDETIENLLNENISDILKDYDIEPLFAPSLKSRGEIIDEQPVSVNILIESRPEIKLPEIEDIEVERLISVVDDTMIDQMVENLRKSQAKFETVNNPVQDDSIVSVEFSMINLGADGEVISRSKKSEMATLNMQELPMEEFREPLLGKSIGDIAEVTIYGRVTESNINMPRPNTRYDLKVVEIGKRILPELTPEFFKLCMGFECETEEDFRDAIAERMLKKLQDDAESDAEARALHIVAEKSGLEVPASLIFREMENIKALDEKDAKERYKMELLELLKLRGMEYAEYEKQIMARAWGIARNSLVLDEIGRKFEIKIEPQDLDDWIKIVAEREGHDAEQLKKAYFKDKDSVNLLVDRVFSDKTIKLLAEKVKIIDVSELTPPVVIKEEKSKDAEESETEEAAVTAETVEAEITEAEIAVTETAEAATTEAATADAETADAETADAEPQKPQKAQRQQKQKKQEKLS